MMFRCQPFSMLAVRRILSPSTTPDHLIGCTSCACAENAIAITAKNIVINRFIIRDYICGNLKTTYHEWNCNGNWHFESEDECLMGHDLDETNGTQCDDFISNW